MSKPIMEEVMNYTNLEQCIAVLAESCRELDGRRDYYSLEDKAAIADAAITVLALWDKPELFDRHSWY
jgi:hypothetical protein